MRPLILGIIFVCITVILHGQGQTRTKKQVSRAFYGNGQLKSVTETWTTLPKFIDPMNFYRKTKVNVKEYDSLTTRKRKEWTRITKIGKDGKPCHELMYEEINYDSAGRRLNYTLSKCDKRRFVFKEYEGGKLVFTRIQKRRKRK